MADFWQALLAGLAGDERDRGCLTIWFWFFVTTVILLTVIMLCDWFALYLY